MKIAAEVWNGSASFHGRICKEILVERAIMVSLKMSVFSILVIF